MDAKFDKDGNLYLKRADKWKVQRCCLPGRGSSPCRDDCPLLVEKCAIYYSHDTTPTTASAGIYKVVEQTIIFGCSRANQDITLKEDERGYDMPIKSQKEI